MSVLASHGVETNYVAGLHQPNPRHLENLASGHCYDREWRVRVRIHLSASSVLMLRGSYAM